VQPRLLFALVCEEKEISRETLINYYPVIPAKAGARQPTEIHELYSGTPLRKSRNDDTSELA